MQRAGHDFSSSIPIKGCVTSRTPHLRATFRAIDTVVATRTLFSFFFNRLCAGYIIWITSMFARFLRTDGFVAVVAGIIIAYPALILG